MGWCGYDIYDGDDTQTRHYDFIHWAALRMSDDDIQNCMSMKGTVLPDDKAKLLEKNAAKVLKKMPKVNNTDDNAIEWQMLLALFADNKITPPKKILEMGLLATEYLRGEHAADFDSPAKRRRKLDAFTKRIKKLYDMGDCPKYSYVGYDWKAGGGCEAEYEVALQEFGLVMTEDPVQDGTDTYGYFITKGTPTEEQIKAMMTDYWGKELIEEIFAEEEEEA